ncbi:hypothetical protein LAB1_13770 [Roseibium sp. LAB1]
MGKRAVDRSANVAQCGDKIVQMSRPGECKLAFHTKSPWPTRLKIGAQWSEFVFPTGQNDYATSFNSG